MKKNICFKYNTAWVIAIVVIIFCLINVAILSKQEQLRYQENIRSEIVNQLSQVRAYLESEINSNIYLVNGIVSLIISIPDISSVEFAKIGNILLQGKNNIRNIALAPNNEVNYVYPIKGNEKALGLIYRDNPAQWPSVEYAIKSRKTIIAGPVELVQGGLAIISRTPVWIPATKENTHERYWGIISLVISIDNIVKNIDLTNLQLKIKLAIRGSDGLNKKSTIFYGESTLFNEDPVIMNITLPNGKWQLGAILKDGESYLSPYFIWIWIGGSIFSFMVGFLVFFWIHAQISQRNTLNEAKQVAEKANSAKNDFLSSMSHELRTPLNAILGFGQLMKTDTIEVLSKTQQGSVDEILTAGQHLLALINDVLDLAKIESGKFEQTIEKVSVYNLSSDCLKLSQPIAKQYGIYISNDCVDNTDMIVMADYMRLKQSLLNLISNAIKYNQKNGRVKISCCKIDNAQIRISVIDTGEGIPDDKTKEIFQPFNRLGLETTQIEGTGIGLAISKNLVEAMAGRIGFESEKGKGTIFWIDLPESIDDGVQIEVLDPDTADENKYLTSFNTKILYIEDNPANQKLMKRILDLLPGVELFIEPDAKCALVTAKREHPELILMDINLPGKSSIELLGDIQKTKEIAKIPIIAVSAMSMSSDIKKAIEAGFTTYITKPFYIEEVLKTIEEVLQKK